MKAVPACMQSVTIAGLYRHWKGSWRQRVRCMAADVASTKNGPHRRLPSFAPVVIVGGGPVGLFLASLLSHYQIPSVLLEAQSVEERFRHPAAHFLNTRTMEILTSTLPSKVSARIRKAMPPVNEWQRFTWGRNLCDPYPLATVVHPVHQPLQVGRDANGVLVQTTVDDTLANEFPRTQPLSPCTVGHLAQHTFGRILYDHVETLAEAQLFYDTQVSHIATLASSDSTEKVTTTLVNPTAEPTIEVRTQQGDIIRTNLCLAADGAHSFIRQQVGIPWQPTKDPPLSQDLYNIHVRLHDDQIQQLEKFPASMLTTTINPTAIAMVVRHSAAEYNIQIPTFPPYQHLDDVEQLLGSIFGFSVAESQVQSLNIWTMTSHVAHNYVQGPIALVGDAAHVFPPAGGFGLNTGLQDAHNLVWKIAMATKEASKGSKWTLVAALSSYDKERRPIAHQNAALSIRNYQRLLEVTKQLYLDEKHPHLLRQSLDISGAFLPLSIRRAMFRSMYQAALKPLAWLDDLQSSYRKHIKSRIARKLQQGVGLPLLFPRFEVLFDYEESTSDEKSAWAFWQDSVCPTDVGLKIGRRLPYIEGEDFLTMERSKTPSFLLLFHKENVDDTLASWLADTSSTPVMSSSSGVVPNTDTVVLVRPDDMVAAVLGRSERRGLEMRLLQALNHSLQLENSA